MDSIIATVGLKKIELALDKIIAFKAADKHINVYYKNNGLYVIDGTIKNLSEKLGGSFVHIERGTLINKSHVNGIIHKGTVLLVATSWKEFTISRRNRAKVKEIFGNKKRYSANAFKWI